MRFAVVCCLLAGCGDNTVLPDAPATDALDASIDGPPPPPGCDWGELDDANNHTAPETTGLVFGGSLVMCGSVDVGHAVASTMLVDADAFGFRAAGTVAVRGELAGAGLEALSRVELAIVNRFGDAIATTRFIGAHAVVVAELAPGAYGIAVRAFGDEPAAPIAYRATVSADVLDRCKVTAAAAYTEALDAAGTGNDMIDVRFASDPRRAFTANAADVPEPTLLVASGDARIAGTSADVDAADEFRDRDTFEVATGAGIDTLTVRVDWSATTVDLDVLVFPANDLADLAGATHVSTTGPEVTTFAVAPSTAYWIWIGSYDASTGLPVAYDISVCAE